jgi:hypothetical protein
LRRLLPRVARELGRHMGLSSLRRLARRLGYSWKRLRCSLKNCRDAMLLTFFQQELVLLHQAEARGELVVVYADECRFSRQVPYAWQRRGQPPVALPAKRGAGGYSVLGLWQAKAPCQLLLSYVLNGALTAEFFAAVPDKPNGTPAACACSFYPPTAPNSTKSRCSGTAANTIGAHLPITNPSSACSND